MLMPFYCGRFEQHGFEASHEYLPKAFFCTGIFRYGHSKRGPWIVDEFFVQTLTARKR